MVTGGAGFIGSNIVDDFIKLGHQVVVVDDLSSGKKEFINPKAKFYQIDIRKREDLKAIFTKEKPEILNHQAAQISVRKSVEDPHFDAEINILGLINLLEEVKENGIKKVIFASSGGAIYGDAKTIPTPEDYEPKIPLSPYGVTKLTSEFYLQYYFSNFKIPYISLRYANVYGPRQNPDGEAGVVAIFSKKLLKNIPPTINGDGKQTRDYIFVGDVVDANIKALTSNFVGLVNIATGKETDVITIFNKLVNMVGVKINPIFGPAKQGEQKKSCLKIDRAKKVLSWTPEVNLEQGLRKTIDYFRTRN